MDNTLFAAKGAVYLLSGTPGQFWRISPGFINAGCPPTIITTAEITASDAVAKTVCFNNKRVAAATSKDFGRVTAGGIALLGEVGSLSNFGNAFLSWFEANRVINSGRAISISSGSGGGGKFLLEIATLGSVSDTTNIQQFSLGGSYLG